MSSKKKTATNPQALQIGSRVRCTEDGILGRIVWANAVSVKIKWDDGEVVTWRRDSLATRPIEIIEESETFMETQAEAVTAPQTVDEAATAPAVAEATNEAPIAESAQPDANVAAKEAKPEPTTPAEQPPATGMKPAQPRP